MCYVNYINNKSMKAVIVLTILFFWGRASTALKVLAQTTASTASGPSSPSPAARIAAVVGTSDVEVTPADVTKAALRERSFLLEVEAEAPAPETEEEDDLPLCPPAPPPAPRLTGADFVARRSQADWGLACEACGPDPPYDLTWRRCRDAREIRSRNPRLQGKKITSFKAFELVNVVKPEDDRISGVAAVAAVAFAAERIAQRNP